MQSKIWDKKKYEMQNWYMRCKTIYELQKRYVMQKKYKWDSKKIWDAKRILDAKIFHRYKGTLKHTDIDY